MNKSRMFRIPPNHKVVRRLDFGGDKDDQANTDNFANKMRELIDTDRHLMTVKYNFDMKNEVPLEGDWIWTKKSKDTWVGVKDVKENDNEKTPMPSREDGRVPPSRRRKMPRDDSGTCKNHVKKRLLLE